MAKSYRKNKANSGGESLSTRAIHAGEPRKKYADSLTTPIIQTSTFTFRNSKAIEDYTKKGKERYEYGRYGNFLNHSLNNSIFGALLFHS